MDFLPFCLATTFCAVLYRFQVGLAKQLPQIELVRKIAEKAGSKSVTPGVCYGEENLKTSYIFSVRRGSGRGGDSIFEVLGKSGLDFGLFWLNCV